MIDEATATGVKNLLEFAAGTAKTDLLTHNGVTFASVPRHGGGAELASLKKLVDEWRTAPERIRGTASAVTLEAFVDLVNRHKDESSVIFGDFKNSALKAVIDYHTIDHAPRFGEHCIAYTFPIAPEWAAWAARDSKPMTQLEWGAFVEDHIADLAAPLDAEGAQFETLFQTKIANPAELISLSRGMALTVEARVKDVRVLQSGEAEISYEEVHNDGSGAKLRVPGLFVVRVPMFIGAEPSRVLARLRYRKVEQRLAWTFQLYRADVALREAMSAALDQAARDTGLPAFEGTPEGPR